MATPSQPITWTGSKPEWGIYWALTQLGYKEGVDFVYQSPQLGGRLEYGGAVLDFLIFDLSLAINVQSTYFHYQSTTTRVHDQMIRSMMEGWGIKVIYIDEADALSNPLYYTQEAIKGIDHSRMTQ